MSTNSIFALNNRVQKLFHNNFFILSTKLKQVFSAISMFTNHAFKLTFLAQEDFEKVAIPTHENLHGILSRPIQNSNSDTDTESAD